mmetsp:Transcript_17701/g.36778  ORF Transcript_17701/g.36778 Transcript_17701/m.36778 type:complete len:224 (+) Transcript_17701:367-1038(+)
MSASLLNYAIAGQQDGSTSLLGISIVPTPMNASTIVIIPSAIQSSKEHTSSCPSHSGHRLTPKVRPSGCPGIVRLNARRSAAGSVTRSSQQFEFVEISAHARSSPSVVTRMAHHGGGFLTKSAPGPAVGPPEVVAIVFLTAMGHGMTTGRRASAVILIALDDEHAARPRPLGNGPVAVIERPLPVGLEGHGVDLTGVRPALAGLRVHVGHAENHGPFAPLLRL